MAHHLVYIPRDHIGDRVRSHPLESVGLSDHREGAECLPIGEGPDGRDGAGGMLFAWRDSGANKRMHFHADQQEWMPAVPHGDREAGRYWIGVWKDAPVTEDDLRKPALLHGADVTLNGSQWHMPVPEFLPHDLMLDSDGSMKTVPKARYQDIALRAQRWRNHLGAERRAVDYIDLFDFVLAALNLNYRLPRELASHMRLIDEESVKQALYAALGWEEVADGK